MSSSSDESKPAEMPVAPEPSGRSLSRRSFLKAASVATAAVTGAAAISFVADEVDNAATPETVSRPLSTPEVNSPVAGVHVQNLSPDILTFFTLEEARTVEAITARILPGTPDDPGAREAGVVNYIDKTLGLIAGFPEATYRQPPFAQTYSGDTPPENTGNYQVVMVQEDELARYGFQSIMLPQEMYRVGLPALDRYCQHQYNASFADLAEDRQDEVVDALAQGKATGFTQPAPDEFFNLLRTHTIEGTFADPAYGGNRDMVGWKLIGYPGAQRAFTPQDIRTEGHMRAPQSMAMLHAFHPGEPANASVALPVSGSNDHIHQGD